MGSNLYSQAGLLALLSYLPGAANRTGTDDRQIGRRPSSGMMFDTVTYIWYITD